MLAVLLATLLQTPARDVPVSTAAGFAAALRNARPGDRITLAPGTYRGEFDARNLRGTATSPIVIAGDPTRPPTLVGRSTGLKLSAVAHMEVRDLVIDGFADNGVNIDDDGRADAPSHHVTLKNLRVLGSAPAGNRDGIKLSGVTDSALLSCTVDRWGAGGSGVDMVGCHRMTVAGCKFSRGGFNGVQAKGGSSDVRVVRCRFVDAGERAVQAGGSTGPEYFRPPLASVPVGERTECRNFVVEGCAFTGSEAAVACCSADGVTVRFNTIYRPGKYALRILQEGDGEGFAACRNGTVEDNVVVFRSDAWVGGGLNIGGRVDASSFRFARNVWYCEDAPGRSTPTLPTAEVGGLVGIDPLLADTAAGDFKLRPGSPAAGRGVGGFVE